MLSLGNSDQVSEIRQVTMGCRKVCWKWWKSYIFLLSFILEILSSLWIGGGGFCWCYLSGVIRQLWWARVKWFWVTVVFMLLSFEPRHVPSVSFQTELLGSCISVCSRASVRFGQVQTWSSANCSNFATFVSLFFFFNMPALIIDLCPSIQVSWWWTLVCPGWY